jgi:O-antigen/teichoic acid export membrane protein
LSVEKTVAKNAAWLILQPLLMNVLSLASAGFIARQLGTSDFGRFNLGLAFVAMFAPLTHLGLRALAVRHLAQNRETASDYLGKLIVLRFTLAVVVALVVSLAAPLSGGKGLTSAVVMVAAITMVINAVVGALADGFQAFEMMRPTTVAAFLGGFLLTVVSVIVVGLRGNIWQMAVAYMLGPLLQLALLVTWCRRLPFRPRLCWDVPAFGQMLKQASPFLAIILVDMVGTRVDVLILARLVGEASLGCYTAAIGLVERVRILSDGTACALMPAIAHLTAQNPLTAVPLLRKSALWLLAVSLPMAIVATALSPLAVSVIFGAQYAAAAPVLALGMWRVPLWCLMMLVMHGLYAVHRQDLALKSCIVMTVFHLSILLPLVHVFGMAGAPIAILLKSLAMFLWRLPVMMRYFPGMWPWKQLAQIGIASALMAIPLALVPFVPMGVETVVLVALSCGIYLWSLVTLRVEPALAALQFVQGRFRKSAAAPAWPAEAAPVSE